MNVHILTIGDELLIGQVINTNASWIGEQMILHGAHVVRTVTLPDDKVLIAKGASLFLHPMPTWLS